jgi:hypothetical protein
VFHYSSDDVTVGLTTYTLLQVQRILQKRTNFVKGINNSWYKNPRFIKGAIEIVKSPP